MMTVVGIDPAIRHTGLAWVTRDGRLRTRTVTPESGWSDEQAFMWVGQHVRAITPAGEPAFVVIEAPFVGLSGRTALRLAGLHYYVRVVLARRRIPFGVVAPTSLKKFAAGHGGATKEQMVALASATFDAGLPFGPWRPLVEDPQHEADALWAMTLGLFHLWTHVRTTAQPMRPGLADEQVREYGKIGKNWPRLLVE